MVFNARIRERVLEELRRKYGILPESVEQHVADQTADVVYNGDVLYDAVDIRPPQLPNVKEFFEGGASHQTVRGSDGHELSLQPADGIGDGIHGYVHLRPGTKDFVEKYVPPGEAVIEQIRLGAGEKLEKVYVSGKTGKPLKRKPKVLPR